MDRKPTNDLARLVVSADRLERQGMCGIAREVRRQSVQIAWKILEHVVPAGKSGNGAAGSGSSSD